MRLLLLLTLVALGLSVSGCEILRDDPCIGENRPLSLMSEQPVERP
jgi:hypothetical protein